MPARRRDGTRTRSLPDWYCSDLSAGNRGVAACPGHFQIFGLYNNATDGSVLKVYALDIYYPSTSDFVLLSLVQGQAGAAVPVTYGSIDSQSPITWGIPIALSSGAKLGTNIGGFLMQQGVPRFFSPGFPFAIVRPNWSFLLQSNGAGTELDASIWWLPAAS